MKAVAMFNFDSRNENEFSFKVGQVIEVKLFLSNQVLKYLMKALYKLG